MNKDLEEEITPKEGENRIEFLADLLNNFHLNFPCTRGGSMRRLLAQGWGGGREYPADDAPFLKQSDADFYNDLDRTLLELGISQDEVKLRMNKRYSSTDPQQEFLLPIYVSMREKGYTRTRLVT
jgi:hypothetical protein